MKNILIVTGIYPPDIGGPATFTKNLRDFINKSEYKVIVITLSNIQNRGWDFFYLTKIWLHFAKIWGITSNEHERPHQKDRSPEKIYAAHLLDPQFILQSLL